MAWQARLASVDDTQATRDAARILATVEYFDDVAPATILHTVNFDFTPPVTRQQVLDRIVAEGQRLRGIRQARSQLKGQEGSTIAVP